MNKKINIEVDTVIPVEISLNNLLKDINPDELIPFVEKGEWTVVSNKYCKNFINVTKKLQEDDYDKLIQSIESGNLNIELLLGKIAIKKLMQNAQTMVQ
jgi:hypothetical protein